MIPKGSCRFDSDRRHTSQTQDCPYICIYAIISDMEEPTVLIQPSAQSKRRKKILPYLFIFLGSLLWSLLGFVMTLGYGIGSKEPDLLFWILSWSYYLPVAMLDLPILGFLPALLLGTSLAVIIEAQLGNKYVWYYSLIFMVSPLLIFLTLTLLD